MTWCSRCWRRSRSCRRRNLKLGRPSPTPPPRTASSRAARCPSWHAATADSTASASSRITGSARSGRCCAVIVRSAASRSPVTSRPPLTYCAITGGEYAITGNSGAGRRTGHLHLQGRLAVRRLGLLQRQVPSRPLPAAAPTAAAGATIQPLPVEVCNGQAQAMAHALDVMAATQSDAPISDPVTGASGTGCRRRSQAPASSSRARMRW